LVKILPPFKKRLVKGISNPVPTLPKIIPLVNFGKNQPSTWVKIKTLKTQLISLPKRRKFKNENP